MCSELCNEEARVLSILSMLFLAQVEHRGGSALARFVQAANITYSSTRQRIARFCDPRVHM